MLKHPVETVSEGWLEGVAAVWSRAQEQLATYRGMTMAQSVDLSETTWGEPSGSHTQQVRYQELIRLEDWLELTRVMLRWLSPLLLVLSQEILKPEVS